MRSIWILLAIPGLLLLAACGQSKESAISSPTTPARQATAVALNDPTGMAFDTDGDLWVANYRGDSLFMYRSQELRKSGKPLPAVVIHGARASVDGPNRLAFDARGYLWVANYGNNTVAAFSPSQLKAGGEVSASVVLDGNGGSFSQPTGLAFDAGGNLWVTNQRGDDLVELGADQLESSGSPLPRVRLAQPGGNGGTLEAVAFDGAGVLWLARYGDDRVVGFTAAQLERSGSPAPVRQFASLHGPIGLTVDAHGAIWVAEYDGPFVERLASGSATPLQVSGAAIQGPHTPAFDSSGNLWVTSADDTILMFSASQLVSGSISTPAVTIRSGR